MYIENRIVMEGPWADIWRFSSEIEKWPSRLPHYRKVTIQKTLEPGKKRQAFMSAWRNFFPVNWITIQTLEAPENPSEARIRYRHIGGVTKGMEVIWSFEPLGKNLYQVVISHDWAPGWFLVGRPAAYLIQTQIVHNIAARTLSTIKRLAYIEAEKVNQGSVAYHKAAL